MSQLSYQCDDCGAEHSLEHIRPNLYYGQRPPQDHSRLNARTAGQHLLAGAPALNQ